MFSLEDEFMTMSYVAQTPQIEGVSYVWYVFMSKTDKTSSYIHSITSIFKIIIGAYM
jgi:hypothetical protein